MLVPARERSRFLDVLRDPVSSASHFSFALAGLVITLFLFRITSGDRAKRFYGMLFGVCVILLYTASGLFHALNLPREELRFYQKLDMSAIYLMIAGSATAIAGPLLRGWFRAVILVGQWAFAAIGIAALWFLPKPHHAVMVGLYLGMGWLATAGVWHYWKATGWSGLAWVMAGSAFYTGGAIVELTNWPVLIPGHLASHEILHFCDMAGTACHFVFIVKYALPYRHPAEGEVVTNLRVCHDHPF
jgi:hemolysin III